MGRKQREGSEAVVFFLFPHKRRRNLELHVCASACADDAVWWLVEPRLYSCSSRAFRGEGVQCLLNTTTYTVEDAY